MNETPTMADVRGQDDAKAALTRAAETGEGVLLVGPPGCGKTMLALRAVSLLPPLTAHEREELAMIYWGAGAVYGETGCGSFRPPEARPFRAPHHTVSQPGLIGNVQRVRCDVHDRPLERPLRIIRPGEVSLAHRGVLFLDELPEFRRSVLDDLEMFLRAGKVNHYVDGAWHSIPARPRVLVGAMNPCPCGWAGSSRRVCRCPAASVERYRARVEPVRDLFPIVVEMDA